MLIVEGATQAQAAHTAFWAEMTVEEHVEHYIAEGKSKMDAIKACAKDRGIPKNEVYKTVNT